MSAATAATPERFEDRSKTSWAGYAAALWALIFAFFHAVWAAGWYVGLWPEEAWRKAFQRTGFLVYDIVIAGACLVAVAVELALVQPWGRRVPRWLLRFLVWSGTGLLTLRGGAGMVQCVYQLIRGTFTLEPMFVWEVWFYLGAILFVLSLRQYRRASRVA